MFTTIRNINSTGSNIKFKGVDQAVMNTIPTKDILGKEVQKDKELFPSLLDSIKGAIKMMSGDNIEEEARKIRQGLDYVA